MKFTPRFAIGFFGFTTSIFALTVWSAHLGRKVWSPEVFAWRNPFKPPPIIEEQTDCPTRLVNSRFYSFKSIGSSVGSVLKLDLKNVSDKPIHSFVISFHSPEFIDSGSNGVRPETLLQPEQSHIVGRSSNGYERVTVSVDFVQFADGDTWFANPPKATVKPDGVKAGAEAATEYLCQVFELDGASAVMSVLPQIRTKMSIWKYSAEGDFGSIGFNYGINKIVVGIEYAYQKNGLLGIEKFLTR